MRREDLDQLLELWARWVLNGKNSREGFSSMLEMMMVTRCQFSGGGGAPNDAIETSIEGAVALLTLQDRLSAKVLRIEFGVWVLCGRPTTQLSKSIALGMPLITYRRKLEKARSFVAGYLEKRPLVN